MRKIILFLFFIINTSVFSQVLFESFENTSGPDALPSTNWTLSSGNWAVFDNGIGLNERWKINNSPPIYPPLVYSGSNCAYVSRENVGLNNTSEDYLATPLVTIPSNGQLRFNSRTFTYGEQGTIYQIKIAPASGSQTNPSDYTLLQEYSESSLSYIYNVYKENVINLSSYAGQQVYIAFVRKYTQPTVGITGDRWLLDNVTIQSAPTCEKPSNVTLESATTTSATVSWTNNSSATSWEVIAIPTGSEVITSSSIGIVTSSNPYTFTNLDPYTSYSIYVRAICSIGDVSDWSNSLFTAPVQICSSPLQLTASNITSTSVDLNWDEINGATNWEIMAVPQGSSTNSYVSSNTNPFTLTGLNPETCYTIYVRSVCSPNSKSNWSSYGYVCTTTCVDNINCGDFLVLIAFLDSNNNGIKDAGELNFNNGHFNYQVNSSGNSFQGITNTNYFYLPDPSYSNLYNFQYAVLDYMSNYYTCSTTFNNVSIVQNSGLTYLYFPITFNQSHIDAQVSMNALNFAIPGQTFILNITYKNNSHNIINSGVINFNKDPFLSITSISQQGTIPTANGFMYNFTNLQPFETRVFQVLLHIPTIPVVSLGQLVTNSVSIDTNNDDVLTNNNFSVTHSIMGSQDPNYISESHGEQIIYSNFSNNDYLYYTILFENIGTANAQFVKIENTLNSKLDETTFELLHASHNVNTTINGVNAEFKFYDINLPPTATQPNNSHGYVVYKIKPKPGYAIGDIIPNTASIYFDTNPAIVTNTFNTEFISNLSTSTFEEGVFTLYPNPAHDKITIHLNRSSDAISLVTIYDLLGSRISDSKGNSSDTITMDISNLPKGIYMVEISTDSGFKQNKKIILSY